MRVVFDVLVSVGFPSLGRTCCETLVPCVFKWQHIIATTFFLAPHVLTQVLDRSALVAQRHRRSLVGKLYLHAGAVLQIDLEVFARFRALL